ATVVDSAPTKHTAHTGAHAPPATPSVVSELRRIASRKFRTASSVMSRSLIAEPPPNPAPRLCLPLRLPSARPTAISRRPWSPNGRRTAPPAAARASPSQSSSQDGSEAPAAKSKSLRLSPHPDFPSAHPPAKLSAGSPALAQSPYVAARRRKVRSAGARCVLSAAHVRALPARAPRAQRAPLPPAAVAAPRFLPASSAVTN